MDYEKEFWSEAFELSANPYLLSPRMEKMELRRDERRLGRVSVR